MVQYNKVLGTFYLASECFENQIWIVFVGTHPPNESASANDVCI